MNAVRKRAYDYASVLPHCKYPEKWDEDKLAGIEWLKGFRKRHPSISLRKPENTSAARASAFNRHTVNEFFNNYESVLRRFSFTPEKIYNLDESGVTIVQKTPKVLAEKRHKQVGQIVSAERGQQVTFCAIVSAVGSCIPPAFVFPRVHYKEHFLNGAPESSLGLATKSGWITSEAFLKVLEHLKKHSGCSRDQPILLLLDNHESHASINAVRFCKENGIVLLSFPPHTSHRFQPLDISIFGPFKSKLSVVFNNWHLNYPGRTLTIYDLPALIKIAYFEAFSMRNITSGFSKPGIWPLYRLAFSDADFSAAYVTDRPETSAITAPEAHPLHSPPDPAEANTTSNTTIPPPAPETLGSQLRHSTPEPPEKTTTLDTAIPEAPETSDTSVISPEIIRPFPKAPVRKQTGRGRQGKSRIYTDTPEKERLELVAEEKRKKRAEAFLKKTKRRKKNERLVESSSENEEDIISQHSDSDIYDIESDLESIEEVNCEQKEKLSAFDINTNDFLLIKLGQKRSVHYVAQVLDKSSMTEYEVSYLRKRQGFGRIMFTFPKEPDMAYANFTDVVLKLTPQAKSVTVRRSHLYSFEENLSSFNIE